MREMKVVIPGVDVEKGATGKRHPKYGKTLEVSDGPGSTLELAIDGKVIRVHLYHIKKAIELWGKFV